MFWSSDIKMANQRKNGKTKKNEVQKFELSGIEGEGREASTADHVLNRVIEELTDYRGEDLTPDEVIVKEGGGEEEDLTPNEVIVKEELERLKKKEPELVFDDGFSLHPKLDLSDSNTDSFKEFINHALADSRIHYSPKKNSFYRVVGKEASTTTQEISPEKVVDTIVNYALEFTDEDDVDADTVLEEKLEELKAAADEAAAKKVFTEVLPLMEDRYEGLTFPGKSKGSKKEKEERGKFVDDFLEEFKGEKGDFRDEVGEHFLVEYLKTIDESADHLGIDVASAVALQGVGLYKEVTTLSRESARELWQEGQKHIHAYEALSLKTPKKVRDQAWQRVLDFYSLRSTEAKDLMDRLSDQDKIAALEEEKDGIKAERDDIEKTKMGVSDDLIKLRRDYSEKERELKEKEEELGRRNARVGELESNVTTYQKHNRFLKRINYVTAAAAAMIAGLTAAGLYLIPRSVPEAETIPGRNWGASIEANVQSVKGTDEAFDGYVCSVEKAGGKVYAHPPCYPAGLTEVHAKMGGSEKSRESFIDNLYLAGVCDDKEVREAGENELLVFDCEGRK